MEYALPTKVLDCMFERTSFFLKRSLVVDICGVPNGGSEVSSRKRKSAVERSMCPSPGAPTAYIHPTIWTLHNPEGYFCIFTRIKLP